MVNKKWATQTKRRKRVKIECIAHYSPKMKCRMCFFSDIRALSMDHIKGNGTKHRKEIRDHNIYTWLKTRNYPSGFQVLCMNCQFIKRYKQKEYGFRPMVIK